MSVDLWWFVGGTAAVLGALVWRQVQRLRARAQLARALRDADPVRRRAAVAVAVEQGLRRHAALLGERVTAETDPGVRAALVTAVLRAAWEPADRRDVLRLRLWAQEETTRRQGSVPATPVDSRTPAVLGRQVPEPRVGGHRRTRSATDPLTIAFPVQAPLDRGRSRSRHAAGRPVIDPPTAAIPTAAIPTGASSAVASPTVAIPAVATPAVAIPAVPTTTAVADAAAASRTAAIPTTTLPTGALSAASSERADAAASVGTPAAASTRPRVRPTPTRRELTIDGPTLRPFAVRG
ncbi:MAG TPA: hypothetical protein VGE11_04060 [Pseudonocardia sp.]